MKLSYEWLKEYVDIGVSPEELARGLTMSGSEVEAIQDAGGDKILDLEITPNRPDCLNIIGLAREASVVFDKDLRLPVMGISGEPAAEKAAGIECVIKDRKLCPRYTARIISGVRVEQADERIRKRIVALGLRAVNSIVDITNFCLMETGQPLHAFDLDRIKGGKVIIREAAPGEKIVTIDGVERELKPGILVIADSARPIAIAGVMGGKDTEVSESTRNILLESAYFDPVSIRRTSRMLGLSSDSSYRFERGVDKGMIAAASDRAAALISAETGGKISGFYDTGGAAAEKVSIEFSAGKAERILGIPLENEKVKHILRKLGMTVSEAEERGLLVSVPSFREDLRKEIDLLEEIARIYGYDNIPVTIKEFVPQVERKELSRRVGEKLCEILPSLGLNEIMTYSLISDVSADRFPDLSEKPVALSNPLSEEQKVLTPQLIDGMLRAISRNLNRKNSDLMLFEIGKIYSKSGAPKLKRIVLDEGDYKETPALCIGLTGALRKNWQEGERPADLYSLKGIVETILRALKISAEFCRTSIKGFADCAEIRLPDGNLNIGFFGEVDTKLLGEYDISQRVYICQMKLDRIMEKAVLENRYHAIPRFPSSSRDISVLCDKSFSAGEIHKVISGTGEEIIRGIELLDLYEGEQIPAGKKSLTYSVKYGLDTRTLTEEEIEAVHSKVKETLVKKLGITFR
ncbi:MAG: phenylalanine--tRNA ligase subunit beta [Candidatus Makaraimicrobium thalassicum]|nr:MAG: phenylalanine--tRNA ligase subunit beta [Candidatus Omnitrophota bacterium]